MTDKKNYTPSKEFSRNAHIKNEDEYNVLYTKSIQDPEHFWEGKAHDLYWFENWSNVFEWDKENTKFTWFKDGKINMSYNCLDRHLHERGGKLALVWQGEPENEVRMFTYDQLHEEVCKFGNVLKSKGIKKGDRVCLYLPMIPELAISMLACTRIGAIHSVVFGGFSAESLKDRILDSGCNLLVTSDGSLRAGKVIDLKKNADLAVKECPDVKSVIVVKRANNKIEINEIDSLWEDEMASSEVECAVEKMDSEDPLFILYTSGTTGTSKGVLHTTGGYSVYAHQTFKYIFDYHEKDVYWCTADLGWITGHSYIVYGPLMNGATTLMFEGVPTYPGPDRFWRIIDKFGVNIFYTAPTAIRAVARFGDEWPKKHDLSSLRLLGSVGEPINPEAWEWYHEKIGGGRCPIVDTWWQTETGGIMIAPLPGAFDLKPGSASKPFFGIDAAILREDGSEADIDEAGYLVIRKPWPGIMRTIYGNHKKFVDTFWRKFPGYYLTGDGAKKDKDGDYWIMGRLDDVVNVSGHRLGTAEVEAAIESHPSVAEAAIVPFPHPIKGQALYAFVILKEGFEGSDELKDELRKQVTKKIGPIAKPDKIQFADAFPKTRSGKTMRRILKAIAQGNDDFGNTAFVADPSVIHKLVEERGKQS